VAKRRSKAAEFRPAILPPLESPNQRETTVIWEKKTGRAIANAIVWQDTRVADEVSRYSLQEDKNRFAKRRAFVKHLFSSLKVRGCCNNVRARAAKAELANCLFGTMDAYLVWHLTGGPNGECTRH